VERHFRLELDELKQRLLWMGGLAERAVHQCVRSLEELDEGLLEKFSKKSLPSTRCKSKLMSG
jgi:hypothetical protein